MVKRYELTVLLCPQLTAEELNAWQTKLADQITNAGGTVLRVSQFARRPLAYRIRRKDSGYESAALTIVSEFQLPSNNTAALEQNFKLDTNVLRSMTKNAKPHFNRRLPEIHPPSAKGVPEASVPAAVSTPTVPPAPTAPALSQTELDKRLEEILEAKEI